MGHPPGGRAARPWVAGEQRTAAILLVSGRFRVELPDRAVVLARQGDYVVFRAPHSWHAEEESVVVTVRWPSVPGYAIAPPS